MYVLLLNSNTYPEVNNTKRNLTCRLRSETKRGKVWEGSDLESVKKGALAGVFSKGKADTLDNQANCGKTNFLNFYAQKAIGVRGSEDFEETNKDP